jgi:4-alpha-glucanotransferase
VHRLRRTFALFDVARIDHFRGFVAYWAVPARARHALSGRWRRGPGRAVFDAAARALNRELPLIAEDLGVITPAVERLRDGLGLPGMVVIQFGFDPAEPSSPHNPWNHVEPRVAYTGTHDHDTVRGWYDSIAPERRELVDRAIDDAGVREPEPWWSLIRLALASPARIAMVQAQDVLGLGGEARMNMPGTTGRSWRWALGELPSRDLAQRLRDATEAAGRSAAGAPGLRSKT